MLRFEPLEPRDIPATIPVTTGYLPTQTGAFLDPLHPADVYRVSTYPQDGAGGRLTVSRDAGGSGPANEIVYDGFPFGPDARLGGAATVIPGAPDTGGDRIAFSFPNAGAGPRVGVLAFDGAALTMTASYFVLPEAYRGGFTLQAAPVRLGGDRYELLALAGASGGPVLAALDADTGKIRAEFFVGPADDRSGLYAFQPQGSYVNSPVTGTYAVAINRGPVVGTPPRAAAVGLFSLADGTDLTAELAVLVD